MTRLRPWNAIIAFCLIASCATEHITIDDHGADTISELIKTNRLVLLLVYNQNTVACKRVGLTIAKLEEHFGNSLFVIRCDITRNLATFVHLRYIQTPLVRFMPLVDFTPYIILYIDGKEADHFSGCLSKSQIQAKIDALM